MSNKGWLEVICGSMFSGKTEELIRRIRRAQIAHQHIVVFKPKIDNRYSPSAIVSHSQHELEAVVVARAQEVWDKSSAMSSVVGIDEAQFYDPQIVEVVDRLVDVGIRVIAAGLDLDCRGKPFGSMPDLIVRAEYVTKLLAICTVCHQPASRTKKISGGSELIDVGGADKYTAMCRTCYSKA